MNRIGDLDLFLHVLDQGSITAAARSLDLSVAVASQRLKRLENELGVRLFHRTTRRLHPTPEGLALAQQGRSLVEELESLGANLRESAREVSGMLRVTLSATFGRMYVSPLLPEFMARHPKLRLRTHLTDQSVDLVSEGYDLAIRIGALEDSSLVARPVGAVRRMVVASPDWLAAQGAPRHPRELAASDCIGLLGNGPVWWRFVEQGRAFSVASGGRLEFNHIAPAIDACVAGLGLGAFLSYQIAGHLAAGRLRPVLTEFEPAPRPVQLIYPHARLLPARVRVALDWLEARLRQRLAGLDALEAD